MVFDLGIQAGSYEDDGYDVVYLSDLEEEDELIGYLTVSELKKETYDGNIVNRFYLIIKDPELELKWICSFNTSIYKNDDGLVTIYGKKGGRVYHLLDSISHCLNGTVLGENKSYTVVFDVFRENLNEKVGCVTVRAVEPVNSNAKSPNLEFTQMELLKKGEGSEAKDGNMGELSTSNEVVDISSSIGVYEEASKIAGMVKADGNALSMVNVLAKAEELKNKGSITFERFKELKKAIMDLYDM